MNQVEQECFAGAPQDFLICITVHKAANTGVNMGELYVKVRLDKLSKNTKTHANSENPFFNEYFVFEFHCTLTELLRLTVLFELKKYVLYKKNVCLGELVIDLHSVWNQPNHSYFKRWGRLELPIGDDGNHNEEHYRGHLQIDLTIVSQHSPIKPSGWQEEMATDNLNRDLTKDFDDIKSNLLHDLNTYNQSNIHYFVRFFRGEFAKKSSYMLQVTFAGFKAKTHVAKNTTTPEWNEEINFAWVFPSVAQEFLILIFLYENLQWKCVSEYEISMDEITFKGRPAVGPTYLYFYDPVNPLNYIGRVLMEIHSEILVDKESSHTMVSLPIEAAKETAATTDKAFIVEFLPLFGSHILTSAFNYKIEVKLATMTSNELVGTLKQMSGNSRSATRSKYFRQESPFNSCILEVQLPDVRIKFTSDFFIAEVINFMRSELDTFKVFQLKFPLELRNQGKCLKYILSSISAKVREAFHKNQLNYDLGDDNTMWDHNRQTFLSDYFSKMPNELNQLRQKIKYSYQEHLDTTIADIVNEIQRIMSEISLLANMTRIQDDWPELVITLSSGNKELGTCRLNAKHFMFLKLHKHQSGNQCWKAKSFIFKSTTCVHTCANCGCAVGIILGCLAISPYRERRDFLACIAGDWTSDEQQNWLPNMVQSHFRFNVYVHQAKVRPGCDNRTVCDSQVAVLFGEYLGETQLVQNTLSPIWNAAINFNIIVLPGSISWYQQHPPLIGVEFCSTDSDVVAFGHIAASVVSADNANEWCWGDASRCWSRSPIVKLQKLKSVTPPPLKWVPVARNGLVLAEVLMSAEFQESVGDTELQELPNQPQMTVGIPVSIRPNMLNYVLEVIFVGMRNYTKTSLSSAGKRRAKVFMADLVLSSGLSTSRTRNSINFLVAYASGVVSLPDQQEYWPGMIVTDVVVNSFNRESTLGAALVQNSTNFLQKEKTIKCRPKDYAESSVQSANITENYDEEMALEDYEEEEERNESLGVVNSCWQRLKIMLGLRTAVYANRMALKVDKYVYASDLMNDFRFNWWTKFYNSIYDNLQDSTHLCKHRLVIFPNELEKQPQYSFLQDWAVPVPLVHGIKVKKHVPPKEDVYATLKLQIKLTPYSCDRIDDAGGAGGDMVRPLAAPSNPREQLLLKTITETIHLIVRVYIVQGLKIRSRDWSSDSDCYVKLVLGGKTVSDQAHYVPNQCNPVFGRFFELDASLPGDPMLEVVVYDRDKRKDDLIGSTTIDLEDRWYTKHQAKVGLPLEYSETGYNQWHDVYVPSELLTMLCQQRGIQAPYFYGNVIEVDGMLFGDETLIATSEDMKERLSLTALKNIEKLPSFGYKLVPEHVETRSLYNEMQPGLEQGKLQMWVELYSAKKIMPPHIDITPTPPINYEVRIVVKRVKNIPFGDRNIFGKLMSDVYVTGWCQDANKTQSTDIHFRSFAGEAIFNWRMIYPLAYSPNEDMMVIRRKGGLFEEIEIKQPPIIQLQIWDKDFLSPDDYLGALELNLSNLPEPYATDKAAQKHSKNRKRLNLFNHNSLHGWFQLKPPPKLMLGAPHDKHDGSIELQLDVCTEVEASNAPAGLGNDPPMALEKPHRPESSFNPLTHPFKSAHMLLWNPLRRYFIKFCVVVVCSVTVISLAINLPGKLVEIPLE